MAHFYRFGTASPVINVELGLPGTDIQIPAGKRAVVRRCDGFTLAAGNNQWFINNVAVAAVAGATPGCHLWAMGIAAIGSVGEDPFIYIDATAAAVNVCMSQLNNVGGVVVSGSFSGIIQ
jgi:hypothetical protein